MADRMGPEADPLRPDDGEPQILDPKAVWAAKGNTKKPGMRVEKPGMGNGNVGCTRMLGDVAKARGMSTFTPVAVQVARGGADQYYLIPIDGEAEKISEVKYDKAGSSFRIDLFPYLKQSELVVPSDHNWYVPAKIDLQSKYAPSLLLDFAGRVAVPVQKRGPRKRGQL